MLLAMANLSTMHDQSLPTAATPVWRRLVYILLALGAVPVVGMGGVSSGADAAEMLEVGARLVAVGSESFRDPDAGSRITAELAANFAENAA